MSDQQEDNPKGKIPGEGEAILIESPTEASKREEDARRKRDDEYKDRQLQFNRWLTILTACLVVTSIVYDFINAYQSQTAKIAAEAAQESGAAANNAARIAGNALVTSQKSFQIDQRPYLVTDLPQFSAPGLVPNTPLKASVWFTNIGRTPADKVFTYLKLVPYRVVNNRQYFRTFIDSLFAEIRKRNSAGRNELKTSEAEHDVAPSGRFFSTNPNPVIISAQDITEIQVAENSKLVLFLVGMTSYTDAYGGDYASEFCYFFAGTDPKTWHICDSNNSIK